MIKERIKAKNISNELIEYFMTHGFNNLSVLINIEDNLTRITVEGDIQPSCDNIENLIEKLNLPRMHEYDDYYDNIMGASSEEARIKIVGYLTDKVTIDKDDEKIRIELLRKHGI